MTASSEDDHVDREHELRSFGRKRARGLSPRQQELWRGLLPRVSLDLTKPFEFCASHPPLSPRKGEEHRADAKWASETPAKSPLWLEIGFGGGEHLVWQARANPGVDIIGCEPFVDGVVKVLSAIDTERLANIRLHADDARHVLRWLPPASLDRAFILFPDPWPKKRHVKRRLVNAATLGLLARAMRPGAELRLATDIPDYLRTMLIAIASTPAFAWTARSPEDWRIRPPDWPGTRYEAKAGREGRRCYFLRLVRQP